MRLAGGAVLALLSALVTLMMMVAAAPDERQDLSAQFAFGSRYGRSEPRALQPRNDRFLIGNRYGKRALEAIRCGEGRRMEWRGGVARCRARVELGSRHIPPLPYRSYPGRWVP